MNNLSADAFGSLTVPVYAMRLNCTAYTSGIITLHIGIPDQL
jgi:hypothetical protein